MVNGNDRDWLAGYPPYDKLQPHRESRFPQIIAGLVIGVLVCSIMGVILAAAVGAIIAIIRLAFSV